MFFQPQDAVHCGSLHSGSLQCLGPPILDLGKHTLDWEFFAQKLAFSIVKTVFFAKMSQKLELSLDVFAKCSNFTRCC